MRDEELDSTCPVVPPRQGKPGGRKPQWIKLSLLVLLVGGATGLAWKSGLKDWMNPDRITCDLLVRRLIQ